MNDNRIWNEAFDMAKDQLRHGKIHYSELEKATRNIYRDLLQLENGPVLDVDLVISSGEQQSLPTDSGNYYKHEVVNGKVRCAVCGKLLKSITNNHLKKHKEITTREEYMKKFGVSEKDMHGTIDRKNVKKGKDNALTILGYIMKAYDIKRKGVKPFVVENGFKDIKDLMAQAKEKGIPALDLLKEKAPLPKKDGE